MGPKEANSNDGASHQGEGPVLAEVSAFADFWLDFGRAVESVTAAIVSFFDALVSDALIENVFIHPPNRLASLIDSVEPVTNALDPIWILNVEVTESLIQDLVHKLFGPFLQKLSAENVATVTRTVQHGNEGFLLSNIVFFIIIVIDGATQDGMQRL